MTISVHRRFSTGCRTAFEPCPLVERGKPASALQVNNVLNNKKIWPSGYSYLYFVRANDGAESLQGIPYFYPLATRNASVVLDFQL